MTRSDLDRVLQHAVVLASDPEDSVYRELAGALLWHSRMLDRARRVCTAARAHVAWSQQFSCGAKPSSATMCELQEALAELVRREHDETIAEIDRARSLTPPAVVDAGKEGE